MLSSILFEEGGVLNLSMYLRKRQVIKTLTGNGFKVFYTLLELSVKERRNNKDFDGWVKVSYNQLRQMTGVQSIVRVVDEFLELEDGVIEVRSEDGVSNCYRIASEIVDERMMFYA